MIKTDIMAILRTTELSLTEICRKLTPSQDDIADTTADSNKKSLILHHLNKMCKEGIITKTIDKKYKIVRIDFGKGDSLNVDSLDTIVLPRIVARAGSAEKLIPDTVDNSTIKLNKSLYKPEDLILVEVAGNSMLPTFHDGELLLFKKFRLGEIPDNNQIILARIDDGAKIKRFVKHSNNMGFLLSDNTSDPDNTPIPINDDNFTPIGKYISTVG